MRPNQGKDELINAIRNAWENIRKETFSRLVATMTDRLIKVIEKKNVHLKGNDFIFLFNTPRPYIYFQEELPSIS